MLELLGQCAMHGAGSDWPGLFNKARAAYSRLADSHGVARVRLHLGLAWMARGDLAVAATNLEQAAEAFETHDDLRHHASTSLARAQVSLLLGQTSQALKLAGKAVAAWADIADPAAEALARLTRAQALASAGKVPETAHELLWAERLLGPETTPGARLRVGLARAESLLWIGYPRRAVAQLKRLEHAVSTRGLPAAQAHYWRLLGHGLLLDDPTAAHKALLRALGLYERLGQTYHQVQCELHLARAEHRLMQSTEGRMASLESHMFHAWPVLLTELQGLRRDLQGTRGKVTGGFMGRLQGALGRGAAETPPVGEKPAGAWKRKAKKKAGEPNAEESYGQNYGGGAWGNGRVGRIT